MSKTVRTCSHYGCSNIAGFGVMFSGEWWELAAMEGTLADDWSQVHMLCKCTQQLVFKFEANFGNC
jgi:hypothetical protein